MLTRRRILKTACHSILGALAFGLLYVFVHLTAASIHRLNARWLAITAMAIATAITFGFTGLSGVGVMVVATFIGLIPVLVGGRRMNCLGVILLPLACNMSGVGAAVARWLGLL